MMAASDSTICEAEVSSIGEISGENLASAATAAAPPIQGRCRTGAFMGTLLELEWAARPPNVGSFFSASPRQCGQWQRVAIASYWPARLTSKLITYAHIPRDSRCRVVGGARVHCDGPRRGGAEPVSDHVTRDTGGIQGH